MVSSPFNMLLHPPLTSHDLAAKNYMCDFPCVISCVSSFLDHCISVPYTLRIQWNFGASLIYLHLWRTCRNSDMWKSHGQFSCGLLHVSGCKMLRHTHHKSDLNLHAFQRKICLGKHFLQRSHWNWRRPTPRSSCTVFMCIFSWYFLTNCFPQDSHWSLPPKCISFSCLRRLLSLWKLSSHLSHECWFVMESVFRNFG